MCFSDRNGDDWRLKMGFAGVGWLFLGNTTRYDRHDESQYRGLHINLLHSDSSEGGWGWWGYGRAHS